MLAVGLIIRVVGTNFSPKGGGVVHVVEMGELVQDDVVAQRLGGVHEADIEGDGAIRRAGAPASVSVRETAALVTIAIFGGPKFETIRQILFGFFCQQFLFGIAGTLSGGIF